MYLVNDIGLWMEEYKNACFSLNHLNLLPKPDDERRVCVAGENFMEKMEKENRKTVWIRCPSCGEKTRTKIYPDTVLVRFPLYCAKCKKEYCISIFEMRMKIEK